MLGQDFGRARTFFERAATMDAWDGGAVSAAAEAQLGMMHFHGLVSRAHVV